MTPEGGKPDRHVIAAKIPPWLQGPSALPQAATVGPLRGRTVVEHCDCGGR